jgi:hypothetical protein
MMGGTRLRVVLCGRLHGAEADRAAAAMSRLPDDAQVSRQSGPPADWPQVAAEADLCIVLQSWPDEIPVETAHAVVAACGASRLVVCQGAWCASAGRTRSVWPRAVCVSVEALDARLVYELAVLNGQRAPLPATGALDEMFAAIFELPSPGPSEASMVTSSSADDLRIRD